MDSGAGQTAAPFKVSPYQSGGTALSSTHFYLPSLNLEQSELPKQSIPPSSYSKYTVFCRSPKHCKSFSLAGNIQPPEPLGNSLLSFPQHKLSSSHLLPLIASTRSNISDPDVSVCPPEALLPGGSSLSALCSALCCCCCFPYQATGFDLWQPLWDCQHLQFCTVQPLYFGPQKAFRKTG